MTKVSAGRATTTSQAPCWNLLLSTTTRTTAVVIAPTALTIMRQCRPGFWCRRQKCTMPALRHGEGKKRADREQRSQTRHTREDAICGMADVTDWTPVAIDTATSSV